MVILLFEYDTVLCHFALRSGYPFLVNFQVDLGSGIRGNEYTIFIMPAMGSPSNYLLMCECLPLTELILK